MTKYFNAKVQVVQTRTVHVQVAADSEAAAAELAKAQARLKEPGFSVQDVSLSLVGESDLGVGSRVVHRLFGAGVIDLPPVDVPIRSGSPGSRLLDGYVG